MLRARSLGLRHERYAPCPSTSSCQAQGHLHGRVSMAPLHGRHACASTNPSRAVDASTSSSAAHPVVVTVPVAGTSSSASNGVHDPAHEPAAPLPIALETVAQVASTSLAETASPPVVPIAAASAAIALPADSPAPSAISAPDQQPEPSSSGSAVTPMPPSLFGMAAFPSTASGSEQRFPASAFPSSTPSTAVDPMVSFDSLDSFEEPHTGIFPSNRRTGALGSIAPEDTPEFLTDVELQQALRPFDWLSNQRDIATLSYAVIIGGVVAASVFTFDVTIQYIHDIPDNLAKMGIGGGRVTGLQLLDTSIPFRCIMPIGAGFAVAWLQTMGFAPPLKVVTRAVDSVKDDVKNASLPKDYGQVVRKALASAITLGSGASLGPEAPSVELGANTAAVIIPKRLSRRRQRMLLAAGAAAGVSAAFDAPVAGALFAVEFVLKSSRLGLDRLSTSTVFVSTSVAAAVVGFLRAKGQALGVTGAASHLVGRIPFFSIQPNLLYDVAQFSLLGVGCAGAAVALYEGVRVSEILLRPLPRWVSAPLAGAMCGAIALQFPTVQYGYVNLEEIFRDSTNMSVGGLVALLSAKVAATSVCVGGGLVGGLFAPSLFLGALVGDIVGHFFYEGVADATSFVVVGAAAVLGAACRAPLTAITLMVEITRDTGLLVPLLAAIGTASLVTDYVEGAFSRWLEQRLVELYLQEKTLFWGAELVKEKEKSLGPVDAVESAMGVTTNLYVRHSLPLLQAREAMVAGKVKAAVVVDDNFSPVGVAYLDDVEEELVRQRMLNERDNNFGNR